MFLKSRFSLVFKRISSLLCIHDYALSIIKYLLKDLNKQVYRIHVFQIFFVRKKSQTIYFIILFYYKVKWMNKLRRKKLI